MVEGIAADRAGATRGVSGDIRDQLDRAQGPHALDALQRAETGDVSGFAWRDHDPLDVLVLVRHPSVHLESPALLIVGGEPQLGERDAHLRAPPGGVRGGGRVPDGIELALPTAHFIVLRVTPVGPHASHGNAEPDPCTAIQLWIEGHDDALCISKAVAPCHGARNILGASAVHARGDVQGLLIVEHPDLGAFRRLRSFPGALLDKVRDGFGGGPLGPIESPVDAGCVTLDPGRTRDLGRGLCAEDGGRQEAAEDQGA